MQPRVDVIINRLAKKLAREGSVLKAVREAAAQAKGRVFVHETQTFADLDAAVRALHARGTDCVILAGGDGSYLAGTTALDRVFGSALPQIGFVPGGTVGTIARNWGFDGNAASYTRRLITSALAGTTVVTPRPTLRVVDDHGGDRVGFIFGAGLVARFFDAYYDAPTQGIAAAAGLTASIFFGTFTAGTLARTVLTPSPGRLVVDGVEQRPEAWSLIAASVVRDLGLHMHLLYRAAERPDAFHVVASALPARQLSPQLASVLLGRGLRGEGHVDTLARELKVDLRGAAGPSTYVLDGDRLTAGSVTVTAGPVLSYATPPA